MKIYCTNCGSELEEDAMFCDICGTPVINHTNSGKDARPGAPRSQSRAAKPKKLNKAVIAVVAVLALILVGVAAISAANANVVDLNKYAHVEIEGYNGYGKPMLVVDTNRITRDYADKMQGTGGYMSMFFDAGEMFRNDCMTGSFDRTTGLSNGDVVTFHWESKDRTAEELYGLKIKYKDIRTKVKGLEKVESFDPFENMAVSFSGYSGYGKAEISGVPDYSGELRFTTENDGSLKNGDKAVISVDLGRSSESEFVQQFMSQYGQVPSPISKEFTVSGLEELQSFDPFDYIQLSIHGVSGQAEIDISVDRSQPFMQELDAYADEYWELGNGDVVTVTVSDSSYDEEMLIARLAENYGMVPSRLEKSFEVMDLDDYVTAASQISSYSIDEMCAQMNDVITSIVSGWSENATLDSAEYAGCYVLSRKESVSWGSRNFVIPVYRVTGHVYDKEQNRNISFSYYFALRYINVTADSTGTCTFDSYEKPNPYLELEEFGLPGYYVDGFKDLDDLQRNLIAANAENYTASHVGDLP